jgi:hypothetical protein
MGLLYGMVIFFAIVVAIVISFIVTQYHRGAAQRRSAQQPTITPVAAHISDADLAAKMDAMEQAFQTAFSSTPPTSLPRAVSLPRRRPKPDPPGSGPG